jgi:Methionyl-tRNA formyltransferase
MTKFSILLDKKNPWLEPFVNNFLNHHKSISINLTFSLSEAVKSDVCFVLGYTRIIDLKKIPQQTRFYIIHESSLPQGKGFSPLIWQILEGKNKIKICLIEMREDVDSGPIILQDTISLNGSELYEEIREKQAYFTLNLVKEFIMSKNLPKPQAQKGKESFYKRRSKEDSELDINKTIKEQFNKLRVGNNDERPSFFYFKGHKYSFKNRKR